MKKALVLSFLWWINDSFAQSEADSILLEEIVVWGQSASIFNSGSETHTVTSKGIKSSLSDHISFNTAIHFKKYGNNQLSTVSLRGTSANHTSVLWNGLPVNSPTLGESDFSVWPAFFSEKIGIQKGNGSAIYGSGSIGGTVILDNSSFPIDSLMTIATEVGSFGWRQYTAKWLINKSNFSTQTKLIYSSLENDFKFTLNGTNEIIKQRNASVETKGLDEKIGWNFGSHNFLTNVSYVENWREIQPTKTGFSSDQLETKTLRTTLIHDQYLTDWSYHNSIGFIKDETIFNKSDETSSNRFLLNNQVTKRGTNISYRFGHLLTYTDATSGNYERRPDEWQLNLNGSVSFRLGSVNTSFNARQLLSKEYQVFSPSLGNEIDLLNRQKISITQRIQFSTGFRVPTFNDQYWIPGGNRELEPERSLSLTTGQSITLKTGEISHTLSWDIFFMSVEDWILWLPQIGGFHSPSNIQRVFSRGLEVGIMSFVSYDRTRLELRMDYAFTKSTEERGELSLRGKQLPYTPVHQINGVFDFGMGSWGISIDGIFTGKRFTTLDNTEFDSVESFMILNNSLSKRWVLSGQSMETIFTIQNLLNSDYENLKNHAMPERNYKISVNLKL